MNREQRRREKLYRNFKESLTGGTTPPVYDENDLLDIFDYANDVYDEYVQLEVVILAARLYPESEEFAQRKAFYMYGSLSMTEGAAVMASVHRDESALWTVLDLMVKHPSDEECRKVMKHIAERYPEFDDETAIQIVDACSDLGIFDWLVENRELLKNKCSYPETFLYEMAMEADSRGDYALAASLMEELTEREPFNASFWHMLAQLQVRLDNYSDAINSIEYAVAIDPDSVSYILTKAQILYDMKIDMPKARELVTAIADKNPDDRMALHTLVAMLVFDGDISIAVSRLKQHLASHPDDKEAVEHLLMIGSDADNAEVLDNLYKVSFSTEEEWDAWAKSFYARNQYMQCALIVMTLLRNSGHVPEWSQMLEGFYRNRDYAVIVTLYRDYILAATESDALDLTVTDALVIVLSLLRCDLSMAAKKLIDIVLNLDPSEIFPFEKRMTAVGVCGAMRAISEAISRGDGFDIDSVDPFLAKESE